MTASTTRLAPSPTGALHLGNARTFVLNWVLARRNRWRVLMRVEDLDGPRVRAGAAAEALSDLAWLGLTWSDPVVYQSGRETEYRSALGRLIEAGAAYPCTCTRRDIELAGGAPHAEDQVTVYPGTCRGRWHSAAEAEAATGRAPAWRVRVEAGPVSFTDRFAGEQAFNLSATCGDFVIFKRDGLCAYQLAVVVDDAAAGVDAVVRGDDLLESAARQIHLRRLLGLRPEPDYWHLPLVVGPDGRRLAKRHGDTRISHYRRLGVSPRRVLGLIAYWSGLLEVRRPIEPAEFVERFDPAGVPRRPVVFAEGDDAFLRAGA
jgi:glutamyl-tRNA synthetase